MPTPPPIRGVYRTDPRARAAYAEGAGIFRIVPAAVCRPRDVEDLVRLVRWAVETGTPLVPRGAGSAMGGGNVGEGVVVDLTRLEGREVEVDPAARVARTGAGATLGRLAAVAAPLGLRLPPNPSSGAWATAGGVVATNAAGARSVRYGSVRRWVRGLEVVTADGEVTTLRRGEPADRSVGAVGRFEAEAAPAIRAAADSVRARFPATRKNAAGYALDAWLASGDVIDLLVGSEGTLALTTAVEWRLDPIPPARAALGVALADLGAAADLVAALLPFAPSALELLDRTFLDLTGDAAPPGAEALLLVELEGEDAAALRAVVERAALAARPFARVVETALTPAEEERLWAIRHAASPILASLPEDRRSLQVIEDGCVPVARLGEYVRFLRRATRARGVDAVIFGHAGDGNVHVNLLPEVARPGWEAPVAALLDEVTEAVVRLGGTISGEHGDGRLRAPYLERQYGSEVVELFRRVKRAFDPHAILNPGIKLPSTRHDADAAPLARLKAGAGAAPLPDDIAAALREIERRGGYARDRLELADRGPRPAP